MIIVIQCRDRVGLVAAISQVLAAQQLNIVSLREHVDSTENRFFIRIEVDGDAPAGPLIEQFKAHLPSDALVSINPQPEKKIVVLVTKEYHCLSDILVRHHFKTLGASVLHVIGNYPALGDICQRFDISFSHISHQDQSKETFEQQILDERKARLGMRRLRQVDLDPLKRVLAQDLAQIDLLVEKIG